jgi:hypothetical protein
MTVVPHAPFPSPLGFLPPVTLLRPTFGGVEQAACTSTARVRFQGT